MEISSNIPENRMIRSIADLSDDEVVAVMEHMTLAATDSRYFDALCETIESVTGKRLFCESVGLLRSALAQRYTRIHAGCAAQSAPENQAMDCTALRTYWNKLCSYILRRES